MRLPTEAQLSKEQKEVCFAPADRTLLVVGPPGSGKTVVAIFRQNSLKRMKRNVRALVYNKVLKRYTSIDSTFYSWIGSWWKGATGRTLPQLPRDQPGLYDFERAAQDASGSCRNALARAGHWGHLILDEAQDFAQRAHQFLCMVREVVFSDRDDDDKPSLTILADENQRITNVNSTINEIREAHLLSDDQVYELRRNYRNTSEIARFAASFYTGLRTGMPELPRKRGEKPTLVVTTKINDAVIRIADYAKLNDKQDIGVLVYYNGTRKSLFNRLTTRLDGTSIRVQTYTSNKDDDNNDVSRLKFDAGGSITILCFASAKGLEFDAVFLPELQTIPVGTDDAYTSTKSNLYVMCSRARQRLFLLISDPQRSNQIWNILPNDKNLFDEEED